MRYALVDKNDVVVNVIEMEPGANYTPDEGLTLVAGRDWPAPEPTPVTPIPPSFLARDFFAQLTVSDYTAVKTAVAGNDALGLLWDSLKAQGDAPILSSSPRFLAGWQGLTAALGQERAAVIGQALGIGNA